MDRLFLAILGAWLAAPTHAAATDVGRWTVEKLVALPDAGEVAIDPAGQRALYVVRRADLALNKRRSTLYQVDLKTGMVRPILTSDWIQSVRAIPGTGDYSLLADRGTGVQLYRLDRTGALLPIVATPGTVVIGNSSEGISLSQIEGPIAFGVLAYGWSPDGRSLWYSTATRRLQPVTRFNDDARATVAASDVRLHLVAPDGTDALVASVPGDQPLPFFHSDGGITWAPDSSRIYYPAGDQWSASGYYEKLVAGGPSRKVEAEAIARQSAATGPLGGTVVTQGWGERRHLVETSPTTILKDYGRADFTVGGWFTAGNWRSTDGDVSIVGIRHVEADMRSSLMRLTRKGATEIQAQGGLTACDFTPTLSVGLCIRQSMSRPPELVRVDPARATTTRLVDIAPEYSAMPPLRIEPRRWTNAMGFFATGFVVYPRDHRLGRRYPAIVVTHGNDGDERFANQDLQWEYPVQVWAERGYVVVIVNQPAIAQDERLAAAWDNWTSGKGKLTPREIQDRIWFNAVASFESAIDALVAEGLVDSDRVGIAGYSFGSQMANVAMTQSKMFRVASSGDGGYLEPTGYLFSPGMRRQYDALFGGSPYDARALENYHRLSPTFNAARANGPILQQITKTFTDTKYEFFEALRAAGKPAELVLYPGEDRATSESHLMHIPANRIAAMSENLDWFDFWLLGKESADPAKAARYARWRKMRAPPEAP